VNVQPKTSPWQLSPREAATMDAMVQHGCQKSAARMLHKSIKTIELHCSNARKKIGGHGVSPYVQWDRWRRSCGVTVHRTAP
jgi:DNA-binding CsgD family transcriptional regulator